MFSVQCISHRRRTTHDQQVETKAKLSSLSSTLRSFRRALRLQWSLHHYLALHTNRLKGCRSMMGGVKGERESAYSGERVRHRLASKQTLGAAKERMVCREQKVQLVQAETMAKRQNSLLRTSFLPPAFFFDPSVQLLSSRPLLHPSIPSFFILIQPFPPSFFPPPVPTEHMGPGGLLLSRISPPC